MLIFRFNSLSDVDEYIFKTILTKFIIQNFALLQFY